MGSHNAPHPRAVHHSSAHQHRRGLQGALFLSIAIFALELVAGIIANSVALLADAGHVFADSWELKRFSRCDHCFPARLERIQRMNLSQSCEPEVHCWVCRALVPEWPIALS